MAIWLLTDATVTNTRGTAQLTTTNDSTSESTSNSRNSTQNRGASNRSSSQNNVQTVTEDAGGAVSFTVPIRSGLFQTAGTPVCPP